MSGHSKWSTIKHKKALNDAKKGAVYTRLGRNITLAAKEGGGDPVSNFKLRLAIDQARSSSMPQDNIERAIKRGTGELNDGTTIQEMTYEGFAPGGVPILIDVATDNPNRSVADVRTVVSGNGGNLGEMGSVSWQFEEKGLVVIRTAIKQKSEKFGKGDEIIEKDPEEVTLELMEIEGVLDIENTDVEDDESDEKHKGLEIMTDRNSLAQVHKAIEALGYIVMSAEIIKLSKNRLAVTPEVNEKIDKLVEVLEEMDDVLNVWDSRQR